MSKICAAALAFGLTLWAAPLWAQSETLQVEGHVAHPMTLTLDQVKALPPVTVSLTFQSDHGPQTGTYTGALLLDIVKEAAPVDQDSDLVQSPLRPSHARERATGTPASALRARKGGDGAPWRHTIIATGHDGYGVALAIGEISPRFAGKKVLVAYEHDGKPMKGQTFRLVVPGDAHGGRSVNDLASLTIN